MSLEFSDPVYLNGVLSNLSVGNRNIILPWGVEFADSSAFFSLEEGIGYRHEVLSRNESVDGFSHEVVQTIKMAEGLVKLEVREWLEHPACIRRFCRLTCLEDTVLMDFVLRYRFNARCFDWGSIAGVDLDYRNTNVYHQFGVDNAFVANDDYKIKVRVVDSRIPDGFSGYAYLRDSEDAWVMHLRMLPVKWNKEVIKLCSRWFKTKPVPQVMSRALLRIGKIREALWYRGERKPYRNRFARIFSPNAFPMTRLPKGTTLMWDASCEIVSTSNT